MKHATELRPPTWRHGTAHLRGRYLLIAAAVLGVGAWLWRGHAAPPAAEAAVSAPAPAALELTAADLATVREGDAIKGTPFTGELRAVDQALLASPIEGRVATVSVRAGDAVQKGQVLARFDTSDLDARLAEQRAALADAQAQLQAAERAHARQEALHHQNFISRNALDETASVLSARRAVVASKQGALEIASRSLRDATVRSPISGIVASRDVEAGQEVGSKTRMFSVVDLSQLELEADLPPSALASVRVGNLAQVKVEGIAQPVPASVVRISPVAQSGTRTVPVYLRIANPEGRLRVGLFAEGRIETARLRGLVVPHSVVHGEGTARRVWVVRDAKLVSLPVQVIDDEAGDGVIALQAGGALQSNERVVTASLADPKPGMRVTIVAQ